MDELINLRESALRLFTGSRANEVLNDAPAATTAPLDGPALAAALKRAVNQFKAEAMDESGTRVDYTRLRESEGYRRYWSELTPQLRMLNLATLATREERLAFWINLYNALVIDAVVAYEVRESVASQLWGMTFFTRAAYNVGGMRFSCNEIEHGVLRGNAGNPFLPGPQFAANDPRLAHMVTPVDPRIHFALNCASRSCPPIGVYSVDAIDTQLDLAARSFVAADVAVDETQGEVLISSIFKWYAEDFGGAAGVVAFLRQHLPDDERRTWLLAAQQGRLVYREYDWGLNV
ncbi:MAG: DUF547 domain-containing protein [Chloroflexaceae bacterium]|jgi:hypothetical protein|nr:DUF547 domain-containing protein [Chloroflexaceae bacterium]